MNMPQAWVAQWYAPWSNAHADWFAPGTAPRGWERVATLHPVAQRLAYRLWCAHFDVPVRLPARSTVDTPDWFGAQAWQCENWARAGLFIGMVAVAGEPGFLRRWPQGRGRHAASTHADLWRHATRMALARPLVWRQEADAALIDADSLDALKTLGWSCMRALCETWLPHGWSRLMFRCSRNAWMTTRALQPAHACIALRPADLRAVSRAWAASLRLQDALLPALSLGAGTADSSIDHT
jgi:hypothetical protein